MAMIPLVEYAKRHDRDPSVLRHKALRGGFQTAQKIGRDWMIDEEEPYTDLRVKSGKYVGARKTLDNRPASGYNTSDDPAGNIVSAPSGAVD